MKPESDRKKSKRSNKRDYEDEDGDEEVPSLSEIRRNTHRESEHVRCFVTILYQRNEDN